MQLSNICVNIYFVNMIMEVLSQIDNIAHFILSD